jgi:hypothetical protein
MRCAEDYHFADEASTLPIPYVQASQRNAHTLAVEPLVGIFVSICLAANIFVQ